jgi:putative tryptophan/tyrosine transport system substrate-binding protein
MLAKELVELQPEVIFASTTPVTAALQRETRTIPIVFAGVTDPIGDGFVAGLPRPGGNITGFTGEPAAMAGKSLQLLAEIAPGFKRAEFGLSAKLIALLKQIAPQVTRVAVVRNPGLPLDLSQFAAIQAVAPSLRVTVTPVGHRDADEIERGITAFAREPNEA